MRPPHHVEHSAEVIRTWLAGQAAADRLQESMAIVAGWLEEVKIRRARVGGHMTGMRLHGTLARQREGFGFAVTDDGREIFVPGNELADLKPGDRMSFLALPDVTGRPSLRAVKVRKE